MSEKELKNNSLIYVVDGTEDTNKILELCEGMKQGKWVKLDEKDYSFRQLPDFINVVYKKCKIELGAVYDRYKEDIEKISSENPQKYGDAITKMIKDKNITI